MNIGVIRLLNNIDSSVVEDPYYFHTRRIYMRDAAFFKFNMESKCKMTTVSLSPSHTILEKEWFWEIFLYIISIKHYAINRFFVLFYVAFLIHSVFYWRTAKIPLEAFGNMTFTNHWQTHLYAYLMPGCNFDFFIQAGTSAWYFNIISRLLNVLWLDDITILPKRI